MLDSPLTAVVALVVSLVLLRFQAWRAVLFLRPQSVVVDVEAPAHATQVPGELEEAWGQLQKLGFVLLGSHSEKSLWARAIHFVDAVHPVEPVVASLWLGSSEEEQLLLLTQSDRGFVITANHRRPAFERPGTYLAGGIDGASAERVLKVHLRRVAEIGPARVLKTLEERVDAARRWYTTSGKAELRQRHAVGLLWTLGALGMVVASLFRLLTWT